MSEGKIVPLMARTFHLSHGAQFIAVSSQEVPAHYGEANQLAGQRALRETAALLDLSYRGRACVLGADRLEFLNGQVTNQTKGLVPGQGCYAALINHRGRMQSDLGIMVLKDEILLDYEPGMTETVLQRLQPYVVSSSVQLVDVAPYYQLISIQGPLSPNAMSYADVGLALPGLPWQSVSGPTAWGDLCLVNRARTGTSGFDLFVPTAHTESALRRLLAAVESVHGQLAGWQSLDLVRVEAGIPRYGADMDATNLPPEAGLDHNAISYTKGCYIGQEVLARLRTYGQVSKAVRGLRLSDSLTALPSRGARLFLNGKEVGYITSAIKSPALSANLALGYVRKECNQVGTQLTLRIGLEESVATIVPTPFKS